MSETLAPKFTVQVPEVSSVEHRLEEFEVRGVVIFVSDRVDDISADTKAGTLT